MARRRGGFQKKIQYTHWTRGANTVLATGAGISGANVIPAQHEPETLLRIRGEALAVLSSGAKADGVLAQVSTGLILVPEGTGSTVTWSPITDADAPWIWYDSFTIGHHEPVVDVLAIPALSIVRRVIDSKAMRIMRNQEIQLVVENVSINLAAVMDYVFQGRFLAGK